MKKHSLLQIVGLSLSAIFFSSCPCDDCDREIDFIIPNKASISYTVSLTEDLLQFVSPKVSFSNSDGTMDSLILSDTDFESADSKTTVRIYGQDVESTNMKWTQKKEYEKWDVHQTFIVTYIPKETVDTVKSSYFAFNHSITCVASLSSSELSSVNVFGKYQSDINSSGFNVREYLELLKTHPDTLNIYVDSSGKVIEERN